MLPPPAAKHVCSHKTKLSHAHQTLAWSERAIVEPAGEEVLHNPISTNHFGRWRRRRRRRRRYDLRNRHADLAISQRRRFKSS
jgi:hypothetical protein